VHIAGLALSIAIPAGAVDAVALTDDAAGLDAGIRRCHPPPITHNAWIEVEVVEERIGAVEAGAGGGNQVPGRDASIDTTPASRERRS